MKKPSVPDKVWQNDLEELAALVQDQTPSVQLHLTRWQAYCLIAQLQLAFRHPQNNGEPVTVCVEIAHTLEPLFSDSPFLAELIRGGWRQ